MPLIKLDFCVWFWVILSESCVIWRFQNQKSIFGEFPTGEYNVFDANQAYVSDRENREWPIPGKNALKWAQTGNFLQKWPGKPGIFYNREKTH